MRHQAQYRAKESFQTEVIWKESADGRNAVRFFDAKAKKEVPPLAGVYLFVLLCDG